MPPETCNKSILQGQDDGGPDYCCFSHVDQYVKAVSFIKQFFNREYVDLLKILLPWRIAELKSESERQELENKLESLIGNTMYSLELGIANMITRLILKDHHCRFFHAFLQGKADASDLVKEKFNSAVFTTDFSLN